MDNNRTYIELLIDSIKSKSKVLDDIIALTTYQDQLLSLGNSMDMDVFNDTTNEKGILITKLNELNDGFDSLYDRIKDEVGNNKETYKKEILQLQELIRMVTEKSIRIQALEKQNRTKFEQYTFSKKKEIKDFKISAKTASSYYKNMANQHHDQTYFLDKKN